MRETRYIMGMPVVVEIVDAGVTLEVLGEVFAWFEAVDARFSTYKKDSEISRINRGEITNWSEDMQEVMALAEMTGRQTGGWFNVHTPEGTLDPSGIVKGWAIHRAAAQLASKGFRSFYIEAGGDIEVSGRNAEGGPWRVGIRNPLKPAQIVKVVELERGGIATSGDYFRGAHVYIPVGMPAPDEPVKSMTIIGENVLEADRFATAAFAMGKTGIEFVAQQPGLEGYMVDATGIATMTEGFTKYLPAHV